MSSQLILFVNQRVRWPWVSVTLIGAGTPLGGSPDQARAVLKARRLWTVRTAAVIISTLVGTGCGGSARPETQDAPTAVVGPPTSNGYYGAVQTGVSFVSVDGVRSTQLTLASSTDSAPILVTSDPMGPTSCPPSLAQSVECDIARFALLQNIYLWIDYNPVLVSAVRAHVLTGNDVSSRTVRFDASQVAAEAAVHLEPGHHCVAVVVLEDDTIMAANDVPDHSFVSVLSLVVGASAGRDVCAEGLQKLPQADARTLLKTSDGSEHACGYPVLTPHGEVARGDPLSVEVGSCPLPEVVMFIPAAAPIDIRREILLSVLPGSTAPVVYVVAEGKQSGLGDRKGRVAAFQISDNKLADPSIFVGRFV